MSRIPKLDNLGCTPKQQKVLDYFIENKGKAKTPDQIAKDLGYKESNAISGALKKFTKFGYIERKVESKPKKITYINQND